MILRFWFIERVDSFVVGLWRRFDGEVDNRSI